ncbi:zinc finger BED domain-containing protein 5-like [Palaemon carinicauda]|uniref:zinc finger BED domain-containing protein 5-like n=1 Tax=Palaemon carinicauda TaxID=392227 RepID=UPI0035B57CBE
MKVKHYNLSTSSSRRVTSLMEIHRSGSSFNLALGIQDLRGSHDPVSDGKKLLTTSHIVEHRKRLPDNVQLDESTDVSSCSQLLVFVRYINSGDIKDEFLFCSALETTTKADDVMEKVSTFFQEEDLQWENVCGEVLESVIKIVNYIKTKALNTRLFKELCKDMNADHEVLLFYTAVRWLSKGNVINRIFEMKDEIKLFLETQEKKDLVVHFEDEAWNKRAAYLADIFDQLSKLNLKFQGRETHVLLFQDSLRAFVSKLQNWRRKTNLGNIAMFEKLCGVMDESHIQRDQFFKDEITEHLQSLEKEAKRYFPELSQEQEALVRNPFCTERDVSSIPDEIQDEYLSLRNDFQLVIS